MKRVRKSRRFWLINLILLLLYAWTYSEEAAFAVRVADGSCTALVPGRSSRIPCPGVEGGLVGLRLAADPDAQLFDLSPLDLLAPRSAKDIVWLKVSVGGQKYPLLIPDDVSIQAPLIGSELQAPKSAVILWELPRSGEFTMEAGLHRPDEEVGLLLLEANGMQGWAFITSPQDRQGVWWRWRDGQLADPIVGLPFQKSFLAQSQSLLRQVLRAHHGALLLLLVSWLLVFPVKRIRKFWKSRQLPDPGELRLRGRTLSPLVAEKYLPLLFALLALLATLTIANVVLERIPHVQDSITTLFQAQTFAGGRLWAPAPKLPDFFEQEFMLVHNGRWFGKYSPGFPLILALGVLIKQPWVINPLLAALTVPLLYKLGCFMYGRSVGLTAALLLIVSPFFLFMSGSMMAHAVELFWITLFLLAWMASLKKTPEKRWALVAGVALGMAFLTRAYTAVAVSLPFLAFSALARLRAGGMTALYPFLKRAGLLFLGVLPFPLLLLGYQWAVTGDPFQDPRLLYWDFDRPGFGEQVGMNTNAFGLREDDEGMTVVWFHDATQPPRGHTPARGLFNTEANWEALENYLFGWPAVLTLAFCWLAFLTRPLAWQDGALLAAGVGLIGAYVFFWSSGIMYGPRYFYAALPVFLLLTARGIQGTGEWIGGSGGRTAVAVVSGALILGNLLFYLPYALDAHRGYNSISAQNPEMVAEAIRGEALVFVGNQETDGGEYSSFFSSNTPWLDGRIIYARDLGDDQNGRLMAMYPERSIFRWQKDTGLVAYPMAP